MKKYIVLGFLCSAFALFGQKPIAIEFKGIAKKLNDTTLLSETDNPDCKALMATTKPFWDKLKKSYNQDSIQDLKAILVNLESITSLVNAASEKCLFKDSLTKYQDTLSKLYRQAYINASDDTIVKLHIAQLKAEKDGLLLKNQGLQRDIKEKDDWINTLYYAGGGLIVVGLVTLLGFLFLGKSKKKTVETAEKRENTEGSLDVKRMDEKAFAVLENSQNQEQAKKEALKKAKLETEADEKAKAEAIEKAKKEALEKAEADKKAADEKVKAEAEAKRLAALIPSFHLSIPSGDGFFSNDNRFSAYQNGRTVYRFYLLSETEAEFEFCNEATAFAIDKPQTHILAACEPLNARPDKAQGIETEIKGTAYLEDGKWIIKEKAKIKYLNF